MTPKPFNQLADNPGPVEIIKDKSNYLRGTIEESLANALTAAIAADDTQLIKFHGSYQQDDRDIRAEREAKKLEHAFSFMIRVRMPAGLLTAEQWIAFDDIANKQEIQTLKLTTRQAIQFHGIVKWDLKRTMQEINQALMDSLAACGDVNRNVMCSPTPYQSVVHEEAFGYAAKISEHLLPQTRAYHEIWLDEEKIVSSETEIEPLYGKHYLPRKFKIALAVPPYNDTDVFANDIGLIAIEEKGRLAGFNIVAGGGMGMTHNEPQTYPRLADVLGFCAPEHILDVCYHIVGIQRDYGNRSERKLARMKYTIDRMGLDAFKAELHQRLGFSLEPARAYTFIHNGDEYGWHQDKDGKWFLTLFIEGGRVKDDEHYLLKTGLRQTAELKKCDFRLTGNQNLVLGNIKSEDKSLIIKTLSEYGIYQKLASLSGLRRHSIACVALNTCALAMAEAERYLPSLITKIEALLDKYGLLQQDIIIRMTGCPNGCGRPYLGEIGFVGKALGRYNLYLGAGHTGERLNKLYRENIDEPTILAELEPLIADYATRRQTDEPFGDFVIRAGYLRATTHGTNFHH
jgi:sulfite reductase (NADPH) hemoprotein beta-component